MPKPKKELPKTFQGKPIEKMTAKEAQLALKKSIIQGREQRENILDILKRLGEKLPSQDVQLWDNMSQEGGIDGT